MPRLLHGAELLLNVAECFARVLEFAGHRRLRLRRDGGGVGDPFLQGAGHAFEAFRYVLAKLPKLLAEIQSLARQGLQIAL